METSKGLKRKWRLLLSSIVSIVAVLFIVTQWGTIQTSIKALGEANWLYIFAAMITHFGTVLAAAATIYSLRFIPTIRYSTVLVVQYATLFIGRIVPAGVGSIATMARMLVTRGHSVVQSGVILGVSSITTFLGNVAVSTIAVIVSIGALDVHIPSVPKFGIYVGLGVAAAITILVSIKPVRLKIVATGKDILRNISYYKNHKKQLALAVLYGALVTLCFALTMMLITYSLGDTLSLLAAIITISIGSIGIAVTPLPGGAVGAEAALALSLSQFGIATEDALAIALTYRVVTFWFPLLPGYIASQYAIKKQYL